MCLALLLSPSLFPHLSTKLSVPYREIKNTLLFILATYAAWLTWQVKYEIANVPPVKLYCYTNRRIAVKHEIEAKCISFFCALQQDEIHPASVKLIRLSVDKFFLTYQSVIISKVYLLKWCTILLLSHYIYSALVTSYFLD